MRALLVGKDWFLNRAGGLNRYFHGEVYALPQIGVTGTALVSEVKPGQTAPMTLKAMAASEKDPMKVRWDGARREVQSAIQVGAEIINAHFALYAYPWVNQIPTSLPLVVNFQGPYADEMALEARSLGMKARVLYARHLEKVVYRRADAFITLSEAFKEILVMRYAVPRERIHVIPGAIDLAPYLAAPDRRLARERLGWPTERPILITVRRLARRMGLEMLIEAIDIVRKAHPEVLLLIGGKGNLTAELEQIIQSRGLADHVKLLGFVADADLPLAYAAADYTVVPTIALEGFGLVTAESLASGTPVLGTPVGGTPEILRGLQSAMVFDAATPEALTERLLSVLAGKIVLPDAATCRAYSHQYGWDAVAPRIKQLFEGVRR